MVLDQPIDDSVVSDDEDVADTPDEENESDHLEGTEEEDLLASLTVRARGFTFEPLQSAVARLRSLKEDMLQVPLVLSPEPSNARDKNAIALIAALLSGVSDKIGYVRVHDLPRIRDALIKDELGQV